MLMRPYNQYFTETWISRVATLQNQFISSANWRNDVGMSDGMNLALRGVR
jgi:hypothetical protein